MFANPFTPIFGGKPDFFFGRKEILRRFRVALADRGSEDRALFVTGTRGCGKTALVEQLSRVAGECGWMTIDLGAENLTQTLLRRLVSYAEKTSTLSPQVSVSVLGNGGSIAAGSTAKTVRYAQEDLQLVFQNACQVHERGIFVSIDEVQKVPLDDMSAVCEAFQMASRKGHNVILVVAGLPYAYERIIHHEGCTFMRRGVHERLGLFTWEDTLAAFEEAFRSIPDLSVGAEELERLSASSVGHPYLMQLHGFYLVSAINDRNPPRRYKVTRADVEGVLMTAVDAYERRALRPMVDELSQLERELLVGMARTLGEDRVARVADVAAVLGKQPKQLSRAREVLLDEGIILSPGRGELMFNIPYLADYVLKPRGEDEEVALARSWRL